MLMKFLYNGILLILFLFLCGSLTAQSINQIKKEKEQSEKQISYLNKLLKETQNSKSFSLERLNLIQQKIVQSKRIINSLNQEVRYFEGQIQSNEKRISELIADRESMLDLYGKLIYGLWKKRNKTDRLMFIFSSSDFNQAYNRYKYFEQIQNYSRRQLSQISRINDSLYIRNDRLKKYILQKNAALDDINAKNKDLSQQQQNENQIIGDFRKKEKEITGKLRNEQKKRERLTRELNKLIAEQAKKSGGSSGSYKMTPEEKLISDDFAKNKGKLPWPVNQGIISEKFGINSDPVYKQIKMPNNGINITTLRDADVRAVFNGVVSEIILIPGFNNTVIVRHGNFLTVYANLVNIVVKKGQKVSTKQTIGKVAYDTEKGSILNFQLWIIKTKQDPDKQNPEIWLAR
ncbi:peptidase M23 [Odoribacter sp. OF09-27XD]|jgi:murein DD-endopeptidase MepM/ murein hydrolase activator NlpD|nr:peptidase M23 [Odoribacter sp. OF09-27XD]